MTLGDYRRFYAEEIEQVASLASPALVAAFARVPREKFLGPPPWQIASAEVRAMAAAGRIRTKYRTTSDPRHLYHNVVVSIDPGKDINNGQPSALASWIDALNPAGGERVYHMGGGAGYYTAILAEMVGPGGSVVALDAQPDLAGRARQNLSGYPQAAAHTGDGAAFDPGPCDAMLINAGVTHPQAIWLDRLRQGGRLLMPLTIATSPTLGTGAMIKIVREPAGFAAGALTFLAILNGGNLRDPELEAPLRQTLGAAMASGAIFKLQSLRRDAHEPDESCLWHTPGACLSTQPAKCEPEEHI
jgi:protein-L-isoaspartate(D-aspartate) O-methyltransferase